MKTLETQRVGLDTDSNITNQIKDVVNSNKDEVNSTLLNNNATRELDEIFWLGEEEVSILTRNNNEVNNMELQLAEILWKDNEMIELNRKTNYTQPLSVSWVMNEFEMVA